jgi:hypothetical protein
MALTDAELKSEIGEAGGAQEFIRRIHTLNIGDRIDTALATIAASVSLTVANWNVVRAVSDNALAKQVPLAYLLDRIEAALADGDARKLEALLVLLVPSAKGHIGR